MERKPILLCLMVLLLLGNSTYAGTKWIFMYLFSCRLEDSNIGSWHARVSLFLNLNFFQWFIFLPTENCKTQIAYGATLCAFYTCLSTCTSIYGKLVKEADCKPVRPYYTNVLASSASSITLCHDVKQWAMMWASNKILFSIECENVCDH